jgi:hypothetical protein
MGQHERIVLCGRKHFAPKSAKMASKRHLTPLFEYFSTLRQHPEVWLSAGFARHLQTSAARGSHLSAPSREAEV